MKILVTGAGGFIGKNLIAELENRGYHDIFQCDRDTSVEEWDYYLAECEFVYHLAGVNRPKHVEEFLEGNFGAMSFLLEGLKRHRNKAPVVVSSSIQAELDNPYGRSKKQAEEALIRYRDEELAPAYIFRLPNVFGKWCRPDYNSVVATFCHRISHDMEIQISDRANSITLVYIDDVVNEFIRIMEESSSCNEIYCSVKPSYSTTVGWIADKLYEFRGQRENLKIPDMGDELVKKLYSTYLSYLPADSFSYPLCMKMDDRGSFTEFIKTPDRGQISINVSKPGITKGNHWHHTKNEKFLVVKGSALIQFRQIGSEEIIEYHVSEDKLEVVDIPVGYTHNIINEGDGELITVMWANEPFSPKNPDTYYQKV